MNVYPSTACFDTGRALTEDELRKTAPSIFAT
ncbi:phosphoribosylamine-glycine ligase [Agrobacterium radiobacter]